MVRRMLGVVLGRQQFQVSLAAHGDEALELARQRPHHLALVDLTMPGMSGLEVGARLRAEHPTLRTLLFTGSAIGSDEAVGFDAVVPKPLEPGALLAIIRRVALGTSF
jgi:DNA-binding response OmpR family regulator